MAIATRIGKDRRASFRITCVAGFEHYKTLPIFSKSLRFISFNFVSYNQKKFDIILSFLIPSDASNPTDCLPRKRFRSTFFASAAPKYAPPNDGFARRRVQHPDAFHWTAAIRQRAEGSNQMSRTTKLLL
ncbi:MULTISPECIES: hypothetical protein [Burkholderia]|uniref:hypothetical protein n=1 Tax=Burkholderia TaxID=32008 RepID=UPI001E35D081|nr:MULTISPECIES: hypothetical protein [Burkholderia]